MIPGPNMLHCRGPRHKRAARLGLGMLVLALLVSGLPRGGIHNHPPAGHAPDSLHQIFDTLALLDHVADQRPAGDGAQTGTQPGLHVHDVTTPATFLGTGRSGLLTFFAPATWIQPVDALPLDSIEQLPLQRPPIV
ncbi:MAG: hypothetical protein Q8N51_06920 [Gammaproteobacteria bacterium]|nr:hypothetical protein [Gammaproteobacteria bacterium]